MLVMVIWDNGCNEGSFEYYSQYDRINAKGIKEEARHEMWKKYRNMSKTMEIVDIYKED